MTSLLNCIYEEETAVPWAIPVCANLKHAGFAKKCTYRVWEWGGQPSPGFPVASPSGWWCSSKDQFRIRGVFHSIIKLWDFRAAKDLRYDSVQLPTCFIHNNTIWYLPNNNTNNTKYLFHTYYVLGNFLSALCTLIYLVNTAMLCNRDSCYS